MRQGEIIFDIETAGVDFESLDAAAQEYFLKYAKDEEEQLNIKEGMSFYPLTAQIVAIGMLECKSDKGIVLFQDPSPAAKNFSEAGIDYIVGNEKQIIETFWQKLKDYNQFITFNGRSFDCPFISLRSAILKIKPTRDLMPYRYDTKIHIDLLDQMTFYGAMRRRFNLHMWCRAFGITSPKEQGITGYEVKELFKQGRYTDIARYCLGDIHATKQLYGYWEKYIKPQQKEK